MTLAKTSIAQRNTIRLIPSGRLKDAGLAPLAKDRNQFIKQTVIDDYTNHRLIAEEQGLQDLSPRELAFRRAGETFINASFAHRRTGGNRFNDENRGAWYCGFDLNTSLAEIRYHFTRYLQFVNRFYETTQYTECIADFIGEFHDARGISSRSPYLDPDITIGYPAGQILAAELRAQQSPGLIYPSARHPGGTCLVAFIPAAVQNFRPGRLWQFTWSGTSTPTIKEAIGE